jgi:hypothetical protein
MLAAEGFAEGKHISSVGFCRSPTGDMIVVLPKPFSNEVIRGRIASDAVFRADQVFTLIRVFRKIRNDTRFALAATYSTATDRLKQRRFDELLEALEAMVRLRADYRQNGLWLPKRPLLQVNRHGSPIAWPATLCRHPPVIADPDIYFTDTLHIYRQRDPTALLHRLHLYSLRKIFSLTGERRVLRELPEIVDERLSVDRRAAALAYLRLVQRDIFTDRGRSLIAWLKAFFSAGALEVGSQQTFDDTFSYSESFETIWEHIVASIISPFSRSKYALKVGKWFGRGAKTSAGIGPIVDSLAITPEMALLDAKDYRIHGKPDALLGSPADHYKQIIYAQSLALAGDVSHANILAFPAIDQPKLFTLRGCHLWPKLPYSKVCEVLVDYDAAVRNWLGEVTLDVASSFAELLNEIDEFRAKGST